MKIPLSEIQPGELFLKKSRVDFFRANSCEILRQNPPIRIAVTKGLPFEYYVLEGNSRLFVLYGRGAEVIEVRAGRIEEIEPEYSDEYASNVLCYEMGLRSFADLRARVVPDNEYLLRIQKCLAGHVKS